MKRPLHVISFSIFVFFFLMLLSASALASRNILSSIPGFTKVEKGANTLKKYRALRARHHKYMELQNPYYSPGRPHIDTEGGSDLIQSSFRLYEHNQPDLRGTLTLVKHKTGKDSSTLSLHMPNGQEVHLGTLLPWVNSPSGKYFKAERSTDAAIQTVIETLKRRYPQR